MTYLYFIENIHPLWPPCKFPKISSLKPIYIPSSLLQDEANPSSSSQCTFIFPIGISPTIVFDEACEHMSRGKIHKEKEIIRKV
jgi:hypothetical protein